jgi:hypothetical protein
MLLRAHVLSVLLVVKGFLSIGPVIEGMCLDL